MTSRPLRIAFFGLPLAGCLLLRDGHELGLVVLPPVPGPGRRRLARSLPTGVPFVDLLTQPAAPDLDALLTQARPDLLVSWFWTRRFTPAQLAAAPLGAIGAHPSLLPRHRGPNPFFAAIDAGDTWTGVTIHRLTEGYDEGALLAQERIAVGDSNSWQLARRLDRPSLRQLRQTVARLARGERLTETPQSEATATWAAEPSGDLLRVDFAWPTQRILRRLRALSPVPGVALEFSGSRFFLLDAEAAAEFPVALAPGEGAVLGDPPQLVIRSGDGAVRVLAIQLGGDEDLTGEDISDTGIVTGQELAQWVANLDDPCRLAW